MATDQLDLLAHLRSESARFREVLAGIDPNARVPSCPDWNAADLVWHLAEVQHQWGVIVRDKLDDPGMAEEIERAEGYPELLRQFDEANTILVEALDGTADDVPVWTWFQADRSVGFVRRRQAHEALIHRLDAELAVGVATPIDAALAGDGVLEVLEWMYSGVPGWATEERNGPVGRVRTTDTGGDWLVQLGQWSGHSPDTGKTYAAEPSLTLVDAGDAVFEVSGPAADLDRWLWNRPGAADISLDGEVSAFVDVIRSGVQ